MQPGTESKVEKCYRYYRRLPWNNGPFDYVREAQGPEKQRRFFRFGPRQGVYNETLDPLWKTNC